MSLTADSAAAADPPSAPAAVPYLRVNNIEVIYDHVILVLKGVSLDVPQGKIVALLGANGAGKTTTLKAISNLLGAERGDVTKGTIEFQGRRVDRLTPNDLVKLGVCQVMEGRHCFAHLTVEENLLTGAFTRSASRARIRTDLEKVYHYFPRLKQRRASQSGYTSGGEQQMTALGRALPARIALAKTRTAAYAKIFEKVDPREITSRAALAQLPVIRKSELLDLQKASRPFGGFATGRWGEAPHVFASPGPIYEPGGAGADYWRLARALFAAGFRPGDLVHNCFAYHFTPAGSMLESGAHALGCTVFPGGIGQSEQQVQAIADLGPAGYVGTPSFLKIILDKADELGVELPTFKKALVSGEAFPASLRDALSVRGIEGFQAYATADVGS